MGLDAVVYTHRDNLPLSIRKDNPNIDRETGEVYFEDLELVQKHPKDSFTAIYKNLGNISLIAALRTEVSQVLGNDSVIADRVLYSGTHSGDIVGLSEMERLESEINLVKEKTYKIGSPSLQTFLEDLTALVMTAKAQKNPIVFV